MGIRAWKPEAKTIVLLDLDGAEQRPSPGEQHPAMPGTGGTVGWLSPEREMTGYTEKTDVWSIGVMALWMIEGRHPWRTNANPWRPGPRHYGSQALFHAMYQEALTGLNNCTDEGKSRPILLTVAGCEYGPLNQVSSLERRYSRYGSTPIRRTAKSTPEQIVSRRGPSNVVFAKRRPASAQKAEVHCGLNRDHLLPVGAAIVPPATLADWHIATEQVPV